MSHSAEAKDSDPLNMLRHSTAHVLAAAVTELFPGTRYGTGPFLENEFYYDFDSPHQFTPGDFKEIEKKMRSIVGRRIPFEHVDLPKPEAIATFEKLAQPYKVELIERHYPNGGDVSLYRTGDFLDLCLGPHVPDAGAIKAFKLTRLSGAYWNNDEKNTQMQRIYGTAWPSQKEQDEYLEMLAEAERRDHKKLGRELKLFTINELSGAGLPLWLPHGATVRRGIERWGVEAHVCGADPYAAPWSGTWHRLETDQGGNQRDTGFGRTFDNWVFVPGQTSVPKPPFYAVDDPGDEIQGELVRGTPPDPPLMARLRVKQTPPTLGGPIFATVTVPVEEDLSCPDNP